MLPPPFVLLKSALAPAAVFWLPVVLKPSAALPVAVLWLPIVLLNIALLPVAVFRSPVVLTCERETAGRVKAAGGVATSALSPWPC